MGRATAKVEGLDKLAVALKAAGDRRQDRATGAMMRAALVVQRRAVDLVRDDAKSGDIVEGGGRSAPHQRSAPGEAPATDFGDLVRGITPDVVEEGKGVIGIVRSRAPYSAALEYGTIHMEPRPFMGRALRESRKEIMAILRGSQA